MHAFTPEWPDDLKGYEPPSMFDFRYLNAMDIGRYVAREPLATWYTWSETWHLTRAGELRCSSKGSSFDSVRRFADHPDYFIECRLVQPRRRCPDNWVMLEPRNTLRRDEKVSEADAEAFVRLKAAVHDLGVNLLDVVIFDDTHHWWSMHELTTGSLEWTFR